MGSLVSDDGIVVGSAVIFNVINHVREAVKIDDILERFSVLDKYANMSNEIAKGMQLSRAVSLALVQDIWPDLPFAVRQEWDNQFDLYCQSRCPDMNLTTIRNHIRAARTFVIKGIKPKDPNLKFNPYETDISKLVTARSAAESGNLDANPEVWKKLCDNVPVQELRSELNSENSKKNGINILKFELLGPALIAKQHGQEAVVIDEDGFNWESYYDRDSADHDLVFTAIHRIFRALNVKMDEECLAARYRKEMR